MRVKREYIYLATITAIGAFLRLFQIGKDSLWLDESFTVVISTQSFTDIMSNYHLDVHPPLLYLIEHIFIVLQSSVSETAIRLFPALCGIAAIPIFYLIGKEALDENSGLLMAAMLAVSQFAIHYSMEARMYAPLLLAVSVGFLFWIKYIQNDKTKYLIYFSVSFGIAAWFHFFAVIPFVVLLLLLPSIQDIVAGACAPGVIVLPLIPAALQMAHHQLSLTVTGLMGMEVVNSTMWALSGFNAAGFLLLWLLWFVGVWLMWEGKERRLMLACVTMILVSLLFGALSSFAGVHQEFRYYIYLLPVFFLPVVYVVKTTHDKIGWGIWDQKNLTFIPVTALLIFGILLVLIIPLPTYFTTNQRDNWRSAEQLTHGSPRIVIPAFNQIPLTYYSHEAEQGYTYYAEIPANFTQGYVIVGPAGGYDPPMQTWFEGLPVYRNVTGIVIYKVK